MCGILHSPARCNLCLLVTRDVTDHVDYTVVLIQGGVRLSSGGGCGNAPCTSFPWSKSTCGSLQFGPRYLAIFVASAISSKAEIHKEVPARMLNRCMEFFSLNPTEQYALPHACFFSASRAVTCSCSCRIRFDRRGRPHTRLFSEVQRGAYAFRV